MIIKVNNALEQRIDVFTRGVNQMIGIIQDVIIVPVYEDVPEYQGAYRVTPKIVEQKMETSGKFLRDDVTVESIPFFNVGNSSGGSTVYIGNEV